MDRFFPKLIFFVFFLFSVQLHGDKSSKIETTYEQVVLPILEEYCYRCNGDGENRGHVSLDFEIEGLETEIYILEN
ncbi:MAG: hypothetical protein QNL65_03945 [Opitutales bacterium]